MPLLLVVATLMVVLFDVSGRWTIAGAVFVLGVAVMVMVGIVQAVDGAWPRTWWPRERCSRCGHCGHALWECHGAVPDVPAGAGPFDHHGPGPKTGRLL
jgi:hypothetical protein